VDAPDQHDRRLGPDQFVVSMRAAAVTLPMVAAARLAPSASSNTGGAFKLNARGIV